MNGVKERKGERVRKIVLLAVVAFVTAIAVPSLAIAHEDAKGPPCSDIVGGDGFYTTDGTATVIINLDSPACERVSYQAFAIDAGGVTHELTLINTSADGMSLTFQDSIDSSSVCVYAMTSIGGGGHVTDRAPTAEGSCQLLVRGSGGGFTGFS
jgi:hypothetical protein